MKIWQNDTLFLKFTTSRPKKIGQLCAANLSSHCDDKLNHIGPTLSFTNIIPFHGLNNFIVKIKIKYVLWVFRFSEKGGQFVIVDYNTILD
jgi:hypothetical protein